jgi:hypothetical protein
MGCPLSFAQHPRQWWGEPFHVDVKVKDCWVFVARRLLFLEMKIGVMGTDELRFQSRNIRGSVEDR